MFGSVRPVFPPRTFAVGVPEFAPFQRTEWSPLCDDPQDTLRSFLGIQWTLRGIRRIGRGDGSYIAVPVPVRISHIREFGSGFPQVSSPAFRPLPRTSTNRGPGANVWRRPFPGGDPPRQPPLIVIKIRVIVVIIVMVIVMVIVIVVVVVVVIIIIVVVVIMIVMTPASAEATRCSDAARPRALRSARRTQKKYIYIYIYICIYVYV